MLLYSRTGGSIRHLSTVKETDTHAVIPSTLLSNSSSNQQQQQQQLSFSSNSVLTAAPLASSISVTSSLNSARQPIINHSISWSPAPDSTKIDTLRVGRTVSLINSDTRNLNNSILSNEIEHLQKRLLELEKEDLTLNSIYQQEYIEIKNRLKTLEEKQFSGGR